MAIVVATTTSAGIPALGSRLTCPDWGSQDRQRSAEDAGGVLTPRQRTRAGDWARLSSMATRALLFLTLKEPVRTTSGWVCRSNDFR